MGLIQNLRWFFFGHEQKTESRAMSNPVIVPTYMRDSLLNKGIERLTPKQQEAAFVSILAMLIDYRAGILADGMIRAQVKRKGRNGATLVEDRHPWVHLLEKPNDHTPSVLVYKWLFQNLDMVGHADFIVERKPNRFGRITPYSLHPIYPEFGHVMPNYDAKGAIISWDLYRADGTPGRIDAEDILRIRRPHPVAPWLNAGLVEKSAYEIDTLSAQNIFARDLARDQGKPRVMLEAEKPMSRDALLQAGRDFAALYRTGGAGSVPVSHSGLRIQKMTVTPDEIKFLQEKEFTREQLFTLAGVPIQLFSGEAYATGANSHRRGFMENTIQPITNETVAQFQFEYERLFTVRRDSRLFIEAPNMIPVDKRAQLEQDEIRIRTGTPINRVLEERGEEPVVGGDIPLVSATLTPLDLIGEGSI